MQSRRNTYFNFAGNATVALAALVAMPFYLRLMGAEAFGLVGVMYTVAVLAGVLDLGLAATLNRELARLPEDALEVKKTTSMVRTMECLCLAIFALAAFGAMFSLPTALGYWLKNHNLTPQVVSQSLAWIGVHASLQILITFYGAGLQGLQRQLQFNIISSLWAVVRAVTAILGLWQGWIGIAGFFACHAAISLVHMLHMRRSLWRALPKHRFELNWKALRRVRRHMLGIWGTTALGIVLTQIDKIILSRTLSLESFGYYMLIWNIAMLVIKPAQPIYNAYLPQLIQLAARPNSLTDLASAYHEASSRNAVFIWPLAICLAALSYPLLWAYTGSQMVAQQSSLAMSVLVIGSAFNATMLMPYALTQAHGWVSFSVYQNLLACVVIAPICYLASLSGSLNQAVWGWFLVNLGYVVVSIPAMHRKLLPGHMARWYLKDNRLGYFLPEKLEKRLMQG